ncbi:DnaD family protein [Spiroplasma turonicum]|uniref:Putative dnad-like replication protein n=1 Tax=Spiroplasma turonicum TaxID=216946 RepID=A0A0K1P749_9MOLU|nr:DnaD family protein [Spiroplasma turonicum]AKU80103.1 putative dnad-like replication protein [Spiroplasma turonicum]ALX71103.1 putative dnad-like replication protein [Spiroplasma turonicum]
MNQLFKSGYLNKKAVLILNYSKVGLTENQLSIILLIMELSTEEQKNFTPSQLSNYMTLTSNEIEIEISKLLKNNLIKLVVKSKKTILDLSPLFNKLLVNLEDEYAKNKIKENYKIIENKLNYKLNDNDIQKLEEYSSVGISISKITSIIDSSNISNLDELFKVLDSKSKNSSVKITMYNWLND